MEKTGSHRKPPKSGGTIRQRSVLNITSRTNMTIISAIVSQHAEEAAFLWLLRNKAVDAPHYHLADVAKLDNRIEAHIDGLRIAGEPGWELCREALSRPDLGAVFAASVLAFEATGLIESRQCCRSVHHRLRCRVV